MFIKYIRDINCYTMADTTRNHGSNDQPDISKWALN